VVGEKRVGKDGGMSRVEACDGAGSVYELYVHCHTVFVLNSSFGV
jgi:hypothetical protein